MLYYDKTTNTTTRTPKRSNVSFGKTPSTTTLVNNDFLPVVDDGTPDYDPAYQYLRTGGEVQGDQYVRLYDVVERPIDEVRAEKRAQMAAAKNAMRDGGFEIEGVLWDSDYHARIAYAEVAQIIAADPEYTASWKASEGVWVTMDAATLATVQATGRTHIEACFAKYADKLTAIDDAQTAQAVAAITWDG